MWSKCSRERGRNRERESAKKETMLAKIYGQFCAFFMCENHLVAGGKKKQGEEEGEPEEEGQREVAQLP